MVKTALTIAGSDCSGGAGIQADLKTFSAHEVFGMSVITAVVAENTSRVLSIEEMPPAVIGAQIDAVFEDIRVDAVKIGMLPGVEAIRVVAERLRHYKPKLVVVDPVMVAKGGASLMHREAVNVYLQEIVPLATLITPNLPETQELTGMDNLEDLKERCKAAQWLFALCRAKVLIKGGHLPGTAQDLYYDGERFETLEGERIETKNTHGTGCTLSSAIAANLANGIELVNAIRSAKRYLTGAIAHADAMLIGKGHGPVDHFWKFHKE